MTPKHLGPLSALGCALLLLLLLPPAVASAHALFEKSTPAPEAVVARSPATVHIWFSESLSPASKIVVWDRHRHDETAGPATIVPGQSKQLSVPVRPLPAGSYLVLWTSVSADDGHILHGSYVFSVKHRGPLPSLAGVSTGGGGQGWPDLPTLIGLLAHWLELLSAVVWTGTVFISLLIRSAHLLPDAGAAEVESSRRRVLMRASLVVLLFASAVLIALQTYQLAGNRLSGLTAGSTWSSVLAVEYGQLWLGREIIVLAVLALSLLRARRPSRRLLLPIELVLAALYLYLFAGSGHAASAAIGTAGGEQFLSVSVAVDWLHFMADALWFGGQAYLVTVLIPALRLRAQPANIGPLLAALTRFSPAAYLAVALYIASGIFAAKIHIPSWYAFFNSIYGRTLIIKIVLVGLMMAISVLTVYVLRPSLRRAVAAGVTEVRIAPRIGGLVRWLRINPVLGVGVLFATSVLFYYPVPFGFGPPAAAQYTAAGGGLVGKVHIDPGRAGPNRIVIALRTPQGQPVTGAGVRVLSTMLDMVMGTAAGNLRPTGSPGTFAGTAELGMGGDWRLLFLVSFPNGTSRRLTVNIRVNP